LRFPPGTAVRELPGFAAVHFWVQDAAAALPARLLAPAPGEPVLDLCAAPGGKTAQLLERADLDLVALDVDPQRLALVRQTLNRLGLAAALVAADARDVGRWWDQRPFDAILLDAPCTASGVGRRHPDVRWLRRPADIATLAAQQAELLEALWPLLRCGGRLLYATCSIFRAEGQEQIDAFLQRHAAEGAALDPASPGHLLPLPDNGARGGSASHRAVVGDGFYYGLLQKL
jgi:16S rRNA (cytosine967-C5)-methyltransferase